MRIFGVHGAVAESLHIIPIHNFFDVVVVDNFNFADFVGSTEAVKEVTERHGRINGGKVGYQSQVHRFLRVIGAKHRKPCLTGGHDVLVVAENGKGMACQSTGCNVEYAGQKFAGNFIHIRNHQKKTLRCCER